MDDPVIAQLRSLKQTLNDEIKSETARLAALKAEVGLVQKRIDDLHEAVASAVRSIDLFELSPSKAKGPANLGKRIPIAWGHASRMAYGILRTSETPLSVPEIARLTLAQAGVSEPDAVQMKSMVNVLYRSIKEQVEKGRIIEHATKPKTFSPMGR